MKDFEKYRLYTAGRDDDGRRLDRIARKFLPHLSLSLVYKALRSRQLLVNGSRADAGTKIHEGDQIYIFKALLKETVTESAEKKPGGADKNSALPVLHEAGGLLFLNKPRGLLSHGPDSLDSLVKEQYKNRLSSSLSFSPGPLHRLDRNTSGLIVFGLSLEAARNFSILMKKHQAGKYYLAVCSGCMKNKLILTELLSRDRVNNITRQTKDSGGKKAETAALPLYCSEGLTLVLVKITTGITHQIRSQLAGAGNPLAGDGKYAGRNNYRTYFLHSFCMIFPDEKTAGRKTVSCLPDTAALKLLSDFFPKADIRALLKTAENQCSLL
jgi:23S rRNA pseudouridine955/2504/2580 synthase